MQISDIISIVAIIVSIFVFVRQNKYEKVQNKLNEMQIEELQKEKAEKTRSNISAKVVNLGQNNNLIRVCNTGGIKAENIDIVLSGDFDWSIVDRKKLPYEFLEPGLNFDIRFVTSLRSKRMHKVQIKWKENGKEKEKETILSI
jgi:hypothetical protein